MKANQKSKKKAVDRVSKQFSEIMIKAIGLVKEDWTKPWLPVRKKGTFIPQNLEGRIYKGGNMLMLLFYSMLSGYTIPVFFTLKKANSVNLKIKENAVSFPVYYFFKHVVHRITKDSIKYEDYCRLSEKEQDEYYVYPNMRYYNVFNIEQSNFAEVAPEKYRDLQTRFQNQFEEGENLLKVPEIDEMLAGESWICPIHILPSDRAFFSPKEDKIVCPLKEQFKEEFNFYSTLLHEMTHSTGTEERLNRKMGKTFGDPDYAKEELVAELTAAFTSFILGISSSIKTENVSYLRSWLEDMKKEPSFIMDVLADVVAAFNFISEELGIDLSNVETASIDEFETLLAA